MAAVVGPHAADVEAGRHPADVRRPLVDRDPVAGEGGPPRRYAAISPAGPAPRTATVALVVASRSRTIGYEVDGATDRAAKLHHRASPSTLRLEGDDNTAGSGASWTTVRRRVARVSAT